MSIDYRQMIAEWAYKEFIDFDTIPPESDVLDYAKTLLVCANGDGELALAEKNWVLGYTAAKGASDETLEALINYDAKDTLEDLLAANPSMKNLSARCLVYEAIVACSADGEYHPDEQATVRKAAAILEVPEDVVKQLEELYEEEKKIFDRKMKLLMPNGKIF